VRLKSEGERTREGNLMKYTRDMKFFQLEMKQKPSNPSEIRLKISHGFGTE